MNTYSVSVTDENIGHVQRMMDFSCNYMEEKASKLDSEKKNGKWPSPIKQRSFMMTREKFFSEFGRNSFYDDLIPEGHFTLVDLLEVIYKDGDESSTTWKISRQLLHPEDIDGMEMVYLSNRGGIWSVDTSDLDNVTVISLKDIIKYFEDQ
uniref:Uncharacterized protein n=1 Tax=Pithovirus LCPAC403 TaxID=2506596 RepID=A0A481ZBX2_9VIRU|nr:MAG: uncharacterized protein LCPAC403_02800 [Pithovirus LCPAC403]